MDLSGILLGFALGMGCAISTSTLTVLVKRYWVGIKKIGQGYRRWLREKREEKLSSKYRKLLTEPRFKVEEWSVLDGYYVVESSDSVSGYVMTIRIFVDGTNSRIDIRCSRPLSGSGRY